MPNRQDKNRQNVTSTSPTAKGHTPADHSDADVIGSIRMSVAFSAPSPKDDAHRALCVDALVEWLLAEWQRENGETS